MITLEQTLKGHTMKQLIAKIIGLKTEIVTLRSKMEEYDLLAEKLGDELSENGRGYFELSDQFEENLNAGDTDAALVVARTMRVMNHEKFVMKANLVEAECLGEVCNTKLDVTIGMMAEAYEKLSIELKKRV